MKRRRLLNQKLNLQGKPATIIEVGYCSDTRLQEKLYDKSLQHKLLAVIAGEHGIHSGLPCHTLGLPLGAAGAMHIDTASN